MSSHRLSLLIAPFVALTCPAVASAANPFDDSFRSENALADKAAVFHATVGKLPANTKGSDVPLEVRVNGSYVGAQKKGRSLSVSVEWRLVYGDMPGRRGDGPQGMDDRMPELPSRMAPHVCGREVKKGMNLLLGLTRAADASSDCVILSLDVAPADAAAAMRTWDEHHGFAYVHRNADAVASCEAVLDDPAALAAADLVAYAEVDADGFFQANDESYYRATLARAYKDERAKKTRRITLLGFTEDGYPVGTSRRMLLFASERDGELVATRCGGTREVHEEPREVAGEAGVGPSKITCARVLSDDASFHASSLVVHATVQDVIASSARTQRLRMLPTTLYKDDRPIPGDLFDLTVAPDEGISFEEGERVLVFAEPMRNQFSVDTCGSTRALDEPPAEIAGAEAVASGLFHCAPERIDGSLLQRSASIVVGEVVGNQVMTTQGLAEVSVTHAYKGTKYVPESRQIKVYYPLGATASHPKGGAPLAKKQRVLLFLDSFDGDRLRALSCGSIRVLSSEPPQKILNLARVSFADAEGALEPSSPAATPQVSVTSSSCSTTPRSPRPPAPLALLALFTLLALPLAARRLTSRPGVSAVDVPL